MTRLTRSSDIYDPSLIDLAEQVASDLVAAGLPLHACRPAHNGMPTAGGVCLLADDGRLTVAWACATELADSVDDDDGVTLQATPGWRAEKQIREAMASAIAAVLTAQGWTFDLNKWEQPVLGPDNRR